MSKNTNNKEYTFANRFAIEWVETWNSHDLDKILSHYTEDFQLYSPVIRLIASEPSGVLKGKDKIRNYWSKALELMPDLHFDLITAFQGVNSVIVHYKGHRGLSAEVFLFNEEGKVYSSSAHYE